MVIRSINPFPSRLMRGLANASFRDMGEIWRNDGYGWEKIGEMRCTIHHRITPPVSGDPSDANAASAEFVEIHYNRNLPVRIGDHIKARGRQWTIGGGSLSETYGTFSRAVAARPIAATPLIYISLRRYNHATNAWELLSPQLAHVAWEKSQPDRLGGVAIRQFGWIFSPEDATTDLDVRQGDSFYYAGLDAVIQWVPPDPTERREATFWTNVGEGV